jgi:hypothetical protein
MLHADELAYIRGVIVDVIYNRSRLEITHAVVAIDLGNDFPYPKSTNQAWVVAVHGRSQTPPCRRSSDAIAKTSRLHEYEINVAQAGPQAPALFRSRRTH